MSAPPLRVGVSGIPLGNRSGTGGYTEQLLRILLQKGSEDFAPELLLSAKSNPFPSLADRPLSTAVLRWPFRFLSDRLVGDSFSGLDLVHYPNAVGPPTNRVPIVATLHDVSPFVCPETFPTSRARYLRRVFSNVLQVARVILTDTHWQAERIVEIQPEAKDRIRVVTPVLDRAFSNPSPRQSVEGEAWSRPYLLMVGALEPRKRVELAIAAWERSNVEADLHLVGRWGWKTDSIRQAMDRLGRATDRGGGIAERTLPDGRVLRHSESIPTGDLIHLYRNALGLVYSSLFEGFGLPILEAMALGCPVITRRKSAMEEVAGPAGWYFEGDDPEGLADAIEKVAAREDLRKARTALGLERANSHTDDRFFRGLSEAYRLAIR